MSKVVWEIPGSREGHAIEGLASTSLVRQW
jgi:hypothetical protein